MAFVLFDFHLSFVPSRERTNSSSRGFISHTQVRKEVKRRKIIITISASVIYCAFFLLSLKMKRRCLRTAVWLKRYFLKFKLSVFFSSTNNNKIPEKINEVC